MSKKFTNEMVDILNELLGDMFCGFRFELVTKDLEGDILSNPHMHIVPISSRFIESYIFNLANSFYEWLETTCKTRWGITVIYNNTRSCIWSKDGWDDEKVENR